MKIVMLDTDTLGNDVDFSPIERLGNVVKYPSTSPDLVPLRLADAQAAVVNKIKLGKENLSRATDLRLICVTATGYDNVDTDYCRSAGIAVCNVPAYSTESVAQLTLAMALYLVNHLGEYRRFVHDGEYTLSQCANHLTPPYHELSSLTWGIVGGGAIGSRVAELASAFGCRVLICRRSAETRYESADFETICRRSDLLSFHVPLTDETRGMLSRERIFSMKPGAVLINVSRGAVTDETALAEALECGRLGGLGIDVYSSEPLRADHPFRRLSNRLNVCLTPHMAWSAVEARNRCIETVGKNIAAFQNGESLHRIV